MGDDSIASVVPLAKIVQLCYKVQIREIQRVFRIKVLNWYLWELQKCKKILSVILTDINSIVVPVTNKVLNSVKKLFFRI
jgi:hypothetical protein